MQKGFFFRPWTLIIAVLLQNFVPDVIYTGVVKPRLAGTATNFDGTFPHSEFEHVSMKLLFAVYCADLENLEY